MPRSGRPRFTLPLLPLVAAAAIGVSPACADAQRTEASPNLDAAVMAMAAWVAEALDAPVPGRLPKVAFADQQELQARRYGGAAAEGDAALNVVALHDDATETILLQRGWTGATPAELSVLAHELVHHQQQVAKHTFACPGAREAEAYRIQGRWLALFGQDLRTAFDIDPLTLMVLTTCGL